jgi:ADP-ribose pyrophosphatase YjhB (NUDIX family)
LNTFRYCPLCATELVLIAEGRDGGRPACPRGHFIHFENPAVTTMGFLERDGRFLVLQRAHAPFAGEWDLPGGFVEPGESPEQGIRREVREETGLELLSLEILGAFTGQYGSGGRWTVDIAYRAVAGPGEVALSDEKSAAAWLPLGALPPLAFAGERAALAVLQAKLLH